MIKKQQGGKISNDRHVQKIRPTYMAHACRRIRDDLNGEDTRTSAESSYTTQWRVYK